MKDFLEEVKIAARKRIIFTEHALNEMNAEEEIITTAEIKEVILKGEIIEDYPNDKRGHSCLMFFYVSNERPVHVVCSPKKGYLGIITVYVPTLDKWEKDFKIRRQK